MSCHCIPSLQTYIFSEAHLYLNVRYNRYTSNWSNIEGLNITEDFEQLIPFQVLAKDNFHSIFNMHGSFPPSNCLLVMHS